MRIRARCWSSTRRCSQAGTRWSARSSSRSLARAVDGLRALIRRAAGRCPEPSAEVIDAHSVHESAEGVVPAATNGYDHHKNVNGHKRHLLADTLGQLIGVVVTPASAQDRAGAAMLLKRARGRDRLALIWANKAYDGDWRRCARDYERLPAHHAAMVQWAAIIQMTRRAAKPPNTPPAPA